MSSVGVVLAGALVACSGGDSGQTAEQPKPEAEPGGELDIANPKDAAAVDMCSLLPGEAASSMGLNTEGEMDDGPDIASDSPESCVWKTEDGFTSVSLSPLNDRSIQEYYDGKSQYPDYQELTLAGHPAVRANQGDPQQDGFCAVFLATSDDQLLYAHSDTSSDNESDPCGLAQKALETSVPTLPAAG